MINRHILAAAGCNVTQTFALSAIGNLVLGMSACKRNNCGLFSYTTSKVSACLYRTDAVVSSQLIHVKTNMLISYGAHLGAAPQGLDPHNSSYLSLCCPLIVLWMQHHNHLGTPCNSTVTWCSDRVIHGPETAFWAVVPISRRIVSIALHNLAAHCHLHCPTCHMHSAQPPSLSAGLPLPASTSPAPLHYQYNSQSSVALA